MATTGRLVLDTSVWINLLATEQPWAILDALGVRCIAPEEVVRELKRHPITQQIYSFENHPLRRQQSVEVVRLTSAELNIFLTLVSQEPPDALGDGEAAAIAVAQMRQCALALDDRKARRVAFQRFPDISLVMTADILRNLKVRTQLGGEAADLATERAIQFGRMFVPKTP
jgi:predicted nucleic acid-binding protein